jgi:hypothetical protein
MAGQNRWLSTHTFHHYDHYIEQGMCHPCSLAPSTYSLLQSYPTYHDTNLSFAFLALDICNFLRNTRQTNIIHSIYRKKKATSLSAHDVDLYIIITATLDSIFNILLVFIQQWEIQKYLCRIPPL